MKRTDHSASAVRVTSRAAAVHCLSVRPAKVASFVNRQIWEMFVNGKERERETGSGPSLMNRGHARGDVLLEVYACFCRDTCFTC